MARYLNLSVFLVIMLPLFVSAQGAGLWCGTSVSDQLQILERLDRNKAAMHEQAVVFRDFQYVPIKFHLVGRTDSSGMVAKDRVLRMLCLLNEDFAPLNIQFYIKDGFSLIYNDDIFEDHGNNTDFLRLVKDENALNIFLPEDADPPNQTGLGQILGYYSPSQDWLVIDKSEVGKDDLTIPHEVGHFFGLAHPFVGWEPEPWEESIHGNPVDRTISPDGQTIVELANGNNCASAGDRVCDTPADYLFGFGWNSCNFTPAVRDRFGDLLNPDELLWMNYFFGCDPDDYYFSDMQQQLIQQDLDSEERDFLKTGFQPNATAITELPTALAPATDETVSFFNSVNLSWSEVAGADAYLLQVALLPTFTTLTVYDELVTGNAQIINTLEPGRTYYWRVRPIQFHQSCTGFSEIFVFKTGDDKSTQGNDLVSAFEIAQNPVRSNQNLELTIQSNAAFNGSLRLYGVNGQVAQEYGKIDFPIGESAYTLPLGDLTTGIYFLALDTEAGVLIKRLLVRP